MEDPKKPEDESSSESSIDYRQLALFSTIVAELTVLPGGLGGLVYYFTRDRDPLGISWQVWTGGAVALGFGIAFYRIFLLAKQKKQNG